MMVIGHSKVCHPFEYVNKFSFLICVYDGSHTAGVHLQCVSSLVQSLLTLFMTHTNCAGL